MNQEIKNYYLKMLEVPDFLLKPVKNTKVKANKIAIKCLIIESKIENSFCNDGKARSFLLKMLNSVDINKNDITCIQVDTYDLKKTVIKYNAKVILLTDKKFLKLSDKYFFIHHPNEILNDTSLKRITWETLKEIKKWTK